MKVTFILALLLVSTVSAIFAQVGGQVNTTISNSSLLQYEWPQFMGDSSFSRFSAGPAPETPNVLWKANVSGIQTYLSAFGGLIYVGTNTSVVALNPQTGEQVWKTDIPMPMPWPIAYKIDDNHMVVESSCLNPKTGALIWTSQDFCADTGIFSSNVYSPEEKMFYLKVDSYTEGWSFADPSHLPTLVWRTYIPGGGRTGIGTTYGGGLVFPGSFENVQMALDAKTGAVVWTTLTKGPMIFNGAYADGRFFRGGTDDNTMYAFNATTGEVLWTYSPGTSEGYFTTGSAVAYGLVYNLNKDGNLYALDAATGGLVWKHQGPGTMLWPGFPTVADGKIYATTGEAAQYGGEVGNSEFVCLNAFTGALKWKLPIEALAPRESVAIAYGRLFLIPGSVTDAVDAISGSEYDSFNQVWAIGSNNISTSDWTMWRADPSHSSRAAVGPANLTLSWKFTTEGAIISSPSIADGVVYVGSQDKNIYAIGAFSGELLWKFQTQSFIESSPAVADGKLYTGGDDGYVYCLDANTGVLYWKTFVNGDLPYTYGSFVLKSSPAVWSGRVYVGSIDGYLYAIDAVSGNIDWNFQTGGPIHSSPALADGAVYFTSEEPEAGVLYKLDAVSGAQLWKKDLPYEYQFTGGNQMLGSPSVADGTVFASASLRAYYAFDTASGELKWSFSEPNAMEFIASCPLYVDGQVFIINKFSITSLNAITGKEKWSFFTGDELYTSLSYADGKLYMMTSQRHIFILDALNNGTKLASVEMPSASWSSPSIANGRLYIGNHDWNVYCFAPTVTQPTVTPAPENVFTSPQYLTILVVFIAAIVVLIVTLYFFSKRLKRGERPTRTFNWPSLKRQ
jgi:outer membrane protein assembly factor BamB